VSTPEPRTDVAAVRWRMRSLAVCALLVALCFVQEPGLVVPDTKLDLSVDPWAFLGRALDLWDPVGFAGQLQNQAYGYLFPIGPFFALGDLVGLPDWVVQRLWWALLLCLAFLGARRLAAVLGLGTPGTQLLAGLAYALAPRILSTLGPVSAEAWPMALAPWVVVPLVGALRGGPIVRPALRSALVVGCIGGVNAALTLAAVAPAGLYLLTARPGARWWRVTAWWSLGVAAACLWWVVPLFLLGRYSPPFLDFIESAQTTTGSTALVEVVRGTSHWLSFLGSGFGSPWRIGSDLVSEPVLVLNTVLVGAVGLAGLCLVRSAERRWLVLMLAVGLLAVTFGHVGPATSWFAGSERELLDGSLAPLRNVHKFDPLVRLPLVLGLAHGLAVVRARLAERPQSGPAVLAATAVVVVAVLGSAGPALIGRVPPSGSFGAVPGYWEETAGWLEAHGDGRALLVPGSRFGVYYWGSPNDEPLQPLTDAPWEVRNAVPLTTAGHIRFLDTVERRLAAGEGSPGLASFLVRNGVHHVVVRNDLDFLATGAPRPALVHQALLDSPGLHKVEELGPDIAPPDLGGIVVDQGLQPTYAAVEIWTVRPPGDAVDTQAQPARLTPLSDVVEVSGDATTLLEAADAGLVAGRPSVLTVDADRLDVELPLVVGDQLRRREVNFGANLDNQSHTLTPDEPLRLERRLPDYVDDPGDLDPAVRSVARWEGIARVRTSSSASDVDAFGGARLADRPAAAFDGDPDTGWRTAAGRHDEAAWMWVDLASPAPVQSVRIVLPAGAAEATAGVVLTASRDGRQLARVEQPVGATSTVTVPLDVEGDVSSLRVDLVREPGTVDDLGIAELAVDGLDVEQVVAVPAVPEGRVAAAVLLTATTGHRDGCVWLDDVVCSASLEVAGEEDTGLVREVSLGTAQAMQLRARVRPHPGRELDALLAEHVRSPLRVEASSAAVADPRGGAWASVDGDPGTGWVAAAIDEAPTIDLAWTRLRRVTGLRLQLGPLAASRPETVTVTAGGRSFRVDVDASGRADLPEAVRTRTLRVEVDRVQPAYTYVAATGRTEQLAVGISELEVVGGPTRGADLTDRAPVALPCGTGPSLSVDGAELRTGVTTSVAGLWSLEPVTLRICEQQPRELTAGAHRVELASGDGWRAESVLLTQAGLLPSGPAAGGDTLAPQVRTWGSSERSLDVPARAEPVLLSVPENANPGWRATLDGARLDSVTVDGWMQGYVVPAGEAGTVELSFEPTRAYRVGLVSGLVLLGLLALVALLVPGRPSRHPAARIWRVPAVPAACAGVLVLTLLGGTAGLVAAVAVAVASHQVRRRWPARAAAGSALAAGGLFALAGGVLVLTPGSSGGTLIQVLTLAAVAVVLLGRPTARAATG
jgi:arabinofuranan 3-O-arabinosyltransferase